MSASLSVMSRIPRHFSACEKGLFLPVLKVRFTLPFKKPEHILNPAGVTLLNLQIVLTTKKSS